MTDPTALSPLPEQPDRAAEVRVTQAEELLAVAHETSNRSEAERAAAVHRAERAEALLLHFTAEAHRRKWAYEPGLDEDGVPLKSEAFDVLHRLGEEMRLKLEELRRTAGETPAATEAQPESCAYCGKSIQRVSGTLTVWWVHDPGGHTACFPQQASSSPRATPEPAAEARQDGARP